MAFSFVLLRDVVLACALGLLMLNRAILVTVHAPHVSRSNSCGSTGTTALRSPSSRNNGAATDALPSPRCAAAATLLCCRCATTLSLSLSLSLLPSLPCSVAPHLRGSRQATAPERAGRRASRRWKGGAPAATRVAPPVWAPAGATAHLSHTLSLSHTHTLSRAARTAHTPLSFLVCALTSPNRVTRARGPRLKTTTQQKRLPAHIQIGTPPLLSLGEHDDTAGAVRRLIVPCCFGAECLARCPPLDRSPGVVTRPPMAGLLRLSPPVPGGHSSSSS